MTPTPRVMLKPRRAQPFFGRHPWVFAGAIAAVAGAPADGAEVDLVSNTGEWIARGLYNANSKIRVRLYSWQPDQPLDRAFFHDRLTTAVRLRRDILGLDRPGGACRLVFSESDGLSGLTVDRYDRWLAVQFTSLGLAQRRDLLAELLTELTGAAGIYLRTERGIGRLEGLELHDGPFVGEPPPPSITVQDAGGLRFLVNLAEGQKTGFYLDQRENRLAAARYAAGRSVLDAFCYTGGFGLHAARAGATQVEGVDSSAAALELARQNAELNGLTAVQFVQADVFDHLAEQVKAGRRYGMIVLDPPKFARSQSAVPEAIRGYRRLQALALRLLEPDGVLVTCCCTGLISMEMLDSVLAEVAAEGRRDVQILERHAQPADHPVAVSCLESSYLKCLIARVL
jgi:23S rRNA (cytosine1962-C5)-methyltransferase